MFSWLFNSSTMQDNGMSSSDIFSDSMDDAFTDSGPSVNPASGLPMMGDSGLDIEGNPFGTDFSDDMLSGFMDDPFDL